MNDYQKKQQKKINAGMEAHWKGFVSAMGVPMKATWADGLPSAPWGWQAKKEDKAKIGAALESALKDQLLALKAELGNHAASAEGHSDIDYEKRRERRFISSAAEALCGWGAWEVSQAGAFEEAVAAVSSLHALEFPSDPQVLTRVLLRAAADSRCKETPTDVERKVKALAAADELWSEQTPWALHHAATMSSFDSMDRDHIDLVAQHAASLIKAASLRPGCAEAVVKIIDNLGSADLETWFRLGQKTGSTMSHIFIQAEKVPAMVFEGLPLNFWLGAKSELGGASKLGAEILRRLLIASAADESLRQEVCLSVWSGLDKKEIEAFEASFPDASAQDLGRAQAHSGGFGSSAYSRGILLAYRLQDGARRGRGKWAHKALRASGFENPEKLSEDNDIQGDKMRVFFEVLVAQRQAEALRKEVRQAKAERALAAQEAGEPAPKRAPKAKAKSL